MKNGRKILVSNNQLFNLVGSHEEWIRDVCYAPQHVGVDYDRVVSGAEDCKVKIWKKVFNLFLNQQISIMIDLI